MATTLAIDTSSDSGSAAVRVNDRIEGELRLNGSMHHSERLFAVIEEVIRISGVGLDAIDFFTAARGPGSFTGLRVGLAAVEGLGFAKNRPSVGISTLSALAWQVGPTQSLIAPMLDARRGEIYGALFRRTAQELVEVRSPVVLQPAEWLDSLPGDGIVFCGGGADAHQTLIRGSRAGTIVPTDPFLAATLAEMADAGYRESLNPLYIRSSDAKMISAR